MIAHSGVNSLGPISGFISKDPIKNIDVRRDDRVNTKSETEIAFMKNRVPIGTSTFIFKTGKLDKDGKLDRTNIQAKELPRNKTDHVSYDPPQSNKQDQLEYDT